ncbi:MAG: hypothetical protein GW823_09620 [Bacteroidetes bacterium]|nr:hypothetical protein [Bacteroidota bacterium]
MALIRNMFSTKPAIQLEENKQDTEFYVAEISGANYTHRGTRDAGFAYGSPTALLPKLHAIYMELRRRIEKDETTQNHRKYEIEKGIREFESKKENLDKQILNEKENLNREETKIEKALSEIDSIRQNPAKITGDSTVKLGFLIGLIIIIFLTIYLFIFYSSAAYSAFFKNFTADDTNIVNSIFDAQAIGKAFSDGFTELVLILTIPAVFLGLGFLIHKFSEQKGFGKYFKIMGLIITTFIFDFIIAYEIVEKIYNIKKQGSFSEIPDMTIEKSLQQPNFWLIIFAGFVVYIIWGLVFDLVMKEHEKLDKVRYAIKSIEKKVADYKIECKAIKQKIGEYETTRNSNISEIDKLKIDLQGVIIFFNDVREGLNFYFSGWVNYMKGAGMELSIIDDCKNIKESFIVEIQSRNSKSNN